MVTGRDTVTDEIDVRARLCVSCVSLKEQLPNAGYSRCVLSIQCHTRQHIYAQQRITLQS